MGLYQSEISMKIKFSKDYEVKDGTGTVHKKDSVIDVNQASADHFIRRSAAYLAYLLDEAPEEKTIDTKKPGRPKKVTNDAVDQRPAD